MPSIYPPRSRSSLWVWVFFVGLDRAVRGRRLYRSWVPFVSFVGAVFVSFVVPVRGSRSGRLLVSSLPFLVLFAPLVGLGL